MIAFLKKGNYYSYFYQAYFVDIYRMNSLFNKNEFNYFNYL